MINLPNCKSYFDQLTIAEMDLVNRAIGFTIESARPGIPLMFDDRAGRAIEALARWIIECRPKPKEGHP